MNKLVNAFKDLFTKENISLTLGIIGTAGTLWTAFQSRKNIDISLLTIAKRDFNYVVAEMQLVNKSRLAITVTDISIVIDGIVYPCCRDSYIFASHTHKSDGINQRKDYYADKPPFQLAGLGGTYICLAFELSQEALLKLSIPVTFQYSTNRGSAKKTTLLSYRSNL